MRTTVIPAQITTVEDKIAGSLSFTQIAILMIPVFWTTIVYALFPKQLSITLYKIPLVLFVLIVCLLLSIRIKGKVVLNWLIILFSFNLRAKYYVFDKNDSFMRDMDLQPQRKNKKHSVLKRYQRKNKIVLSPAYVTSELTNLKEYIDNPKYSISIKPNKKGGVYVGLKQIQQ